MKARFTGAQIRDIREALTLTTAEFAGVLAVHAGTVSRWESSPEEINVDGIAANLLCVLASHMPPSRWTAAVGAEVRRAMLIGGTLAGVHQLMHNLHQRGAFAMPLPEVAARRRAL